MRNYAFFVLYFNKRINLVIIMAKKSKKLEEIREMVKKLNINYEEIDLSVLNNFVTITKKLDDKRVQYKVKHNMSDIVIITLLGILANANNWIEIHCFAVSHEKWLKTFLELPSGILSHDTIQRVISIINPSTLYTSTVKYLMNLIDNLAKPSNNKDIKSMDGKTINGSSRSELTTDKISPTNVMSIYSHDYGMSIIQDFIGEKSNEIPMGPELIKQLNLSSSIITADALNTQKETVKAVVKAKGDYVLALKANQGTIYQEVSEYFHDNDLLKETEYYSETEKSHSKFIKREYYMINNINWITNYKEWKNLKSIGYEKKTIEFINNDKKIIEERFFIINFENDIKMFADAVRKHWGVENNLHAPLDIVFREDDNTTLEKNGAKNLSILKRIALNIIKIVQCFYNISLKLIRYKISMNTEEELEKIFKIINTKEIKSMLDA